MKLINSMLMRHHAVRGLLACLELIIVSDPLILPTVDYVISTRVWGSRLLVCAWQREIDNSILQVIFFFPVLAAVVQTSSFSLLCDKGWHNARMKLLFKCFLLYGQTSIPGWYDWKADVWLSIIYLSRELKVMCTFPISSHQSPSNAELLSASAIMLLS